MEDGYTDDTDDADDVDGTDTGCWIRGELIRG
jgi:hypothetical protein